MPPGSGMREEIRRWYGAPGVQASCLDLQERHGVDVSLLLALLWLASRGREIGPGEAAAAAAAARRWREGAVLPLRRARRWLKQEGAAVTALRAQIQEAEIEAELLLMERVIGALAPDLPAPAHPSPPDLLNMRSVASIAPWLVAR